MKYSYNLTEEIARWAFEVHVKKNNFWIAFTNPTAGPWKRIESFDVKKNKGEVYRFDREEKRPDIILINDILNIIIIIEAKDNLQKLSNIDQVKKSCKVTIDIAKILKSIKDNKYWLNRFTYKIFNGLLWGSSSKSSKEDIEMLFNNYFKEFKKINFKIIEENQIAIESLKDENNDIILNFYSSSNNKICDEIIKNLKS